MHITIENITISIAEYLSMHQTAHINAYTRVKNFPTHN